MTGRLNMNNQFNNVYKNRKIFITGNTGFKGSWLTAWLLELGADIVGYSLKPPTKPNMFEILSLPERINYIKGDICDREKLENELKNHDPEIVFHLAAQPLVRKSYHHPVLTYETNVMGTVNLFEAVRKCENVKVLVNVTSDKCYENKEENRGYSETDALGGHDPYSSSKACSEIITTTYRKSYFEKNNVDNYNVSLTSVRAGNVIGGGDWAQDRLVPDCIRALTTNNIISIRNPHAIRPWQHVLEPLSGYLWLASLMWRDSVSYNHAWNFGPKEPVNQDVEKVVKEIIRIWGSGQYHTHKDTQISETKILQLNINQAMVKLRWKPIYELREALEKTIHWYWQYYNNERDMYQFTSEQIKNYTRNAMNQNLEWTL